MEDTDVPLGLRDVAAELRNGFLLFAANELAGEECMFTGRVAERFADVGLRAPYGLFVGAGEIGCCVCC